MIDTFLWWSGVALWVVVAPFMIFMLFCLTWGYLLTFGKDDGE